MHDYLKDIPVTERPKMVPLFPSGASCFRAWRSLRWFLALLLPITGSAVAYWLRKHEIGFILFICIVGALVAACLFVALCSGMASSNWGTHFRQTEPIRYWLQIVVMGIAYVGISCAGYFA